MFQLIQNTLGGYFFPLPGHNKVNLFTHLTYKILNNQGDLTSSSVLNHLRVILFISYNFSILYLSQTFPNSSLFHIRIFCLNQQIMQHFSSHWYSAQFHHFSVLFILVSCTLWTRILPDSFPDVLIKLIL